MGKPKPKKGKKRDLAAPMVAVETPNPTSNVKEIEVYLAPDGYRWRAKGGNGEIVATGESHTQHSDAIRAANGVFPTVPVKN